MDETDVRAGSDQNQLNYHASLQRGTEVEGIILCDGKGRPDARGIRFASMPRTAMQIQQGDPDYGSFEMPYTPMTQKDWSGGRGNKDFEKDKTRYADSYNIDTTRGDIRLAPEVKSTTGLQWISKTDKTEMKHYNMGWVFASQRAFYENHTIASIEFETYGAGRIRFRLYADDNGAPGGSVLAEVFSPYFFTRELRTVILPVSYTLNAGTTYWFAFNIAPAAPAEEGYDFAVQEGVGCVIKSSYFFDSWEDYDTAATLAFTIKDKGAAGPLRFFEYKRQLYAVSSPKDGSAPRLWMNGYRGVAKDNSADKTKLNSSLTLEGGAYLDEKIIQITAGPGYEEAQNWRVIESHTTGANAVFTVDQAWNIAHTTATEFVIHDCDTFQEIIGHGLTKPVTDALVYADLVYIAQGKDTPIRRMREYNNNDTWYHFGHGSDTTVNEPTATADLLKLIPDSEGKFKVWRTINSTANVSCSDAKYWSGGDLAFGTEILCGNPNTKINGMRAYGEPLLPWILKEDSIGSIARNIYAEVPISELQAARSEVNGKASCQMGVYLYFNLLKGLERYLDNRLDDCGPNLDEGYPANRQGVISSLITYPGRLYAAIDAGSTGFSSIACWNGVGWHEIYRSLRVGASITSLFIQAIPGERSERGEIPERLWFSEGEDVKYLPLSLNPEHIYEFKYATNGYLISSWFSGSFRDVRKYWNSIRLFAENLNEDTKVRAYYQTDEDEEDEWTQLGTDFTSDGQEIPMNTTTDVEGKRWRYKLELFAKEDYSTHNTTARVKAITIQTITRLPPKRSWTITFLLDDEGTDLQGGATETVAARLARLHKWANSDNGAGRLLWRHPHTMIDGAKVFVDPPSINPFYVVSSEQPHKVKLICTMTLYEA